MKKTAVDIRIMAVPKRRDMVLAMLAQLGMPETIVSYDDRPQGGGPLYTARKCWLHPLQPGCTHRLVLQDDLELCTGFRVVAHLAAAAFPEAIFSFFNPRLRFTDRKTASPYILIPGGGCYGQAIMIPAPLIKPCFRWVDRALGVGYEGDDTAIGLYSHARDVPMMATIPATVQHLAPMNSALGYNNPRKVSKVWQGRDLAGEDWNNRNYSMSKAIPNLTGLPPTHPFSRAPRKPIDRERLRAQLA
jgi:hypothetical protein